MWKHPENRNSAKSQETGGSNVSTLVEECPSPLDGKAPYCVECHATVQSGRFCSLCGAKWMPFSWISV